MACLKTNCLKRFAEREEMIVVDTYEDAGKSGKSIEGRPAFKKMLSDIESGKFMMYARRKNEDLCNTTPLFF